MRMTSQYYLSSGIYSLAITILCLWRFFSFPAKVLGDESVAAVSYVVEPFDTVEDRWFRRLYNDAGRLDLSLVNEHTDHNALFGSGALRVDYQVQATESWGGFVDFGWIQDRTPYNCYGADYISLWYNNLEKQTLPDRVHLRIILLDGSECPKSGYPCSEAPGQALENYYSFHIVLDEEPGWKELRVDLTGDDDSTSPFWRTGWTGQVGNNVLDPQNIRGWRLEWSMDSQAGINATSEGTMLLDHLACYGGGELLGASFHASSEISNENDNVSVYDQAIASGAWYERFYQSEVARNQSHVDLKNATLELDYTVQHVEEWGGFDDFGTIAPGNAYYNLSGSSHLSFGYDVQRVADPPSRCHVRLILLDDSDCNRTSSSCDSEPYLENYYTFNYILDTMGIGEVKTLLEGNDDVSSPFYRPGWTGIVGNNYLDKERIKGYRIEINSDSQGTIGSLINGKVSFSKVLAHPSAGGSNSNSSTADPVETPPRCNMEAGLRFDVEKGNPDSRFHRIEFVGSRCCEWCEQDPECLYALSDGRDCYVASSLEAKAVRIVDSDFTSDEIRAFASQSISKRGDLCDKCDCDRNSLSIDCRNKDLKIVPIAFNLEWAPRYLDLRDNDQLVFIDDVAFANFGSGLEKIFLPQSLVHLSPGAVTELPVLRELVFDEQALTSGATGAPKLNNVISSPLDAFDHVCCNRGLHLELNSPKEGLNFCDLHMKQPGDDSTYEPFMMYLNAAPGRIMEIRPRSPFMGEAAESVQKCAEFCSILDDCKYFSYDARWKESEHRCILLNHNGTHLVRECCQPDHYGNEEGTIAGWTSGKAPRARFLDDDARVLVGPSELRIDQETGFTATYQVSLGSSPLVGAVWVTPVVSDTAQIDVRIFPERVAIYDNETIANFNISIGDTSSVSTGTVVRIDNLVISCDSAFTAVDPELLRLQTSVRVAVVPQEDRTYISRAFRITGIVFVSVQCAVILFFALWTFRYRDAQVVRMSQPIFLGLVLFGCLMVALSIIPTLAQDGPGQTNANLDAACMAFPWLFNMGFILIFSALFAKISRVRLIIDNAISMRRVTVKAKDVGLIVVFFSSVPFVILLCWQLIDPLQWDREITRSNNYGYALESVGFCNGEKPLAFLLPLAVYDFGCLLYALYLCYRTRSFSSELNEAKWITASIISIFQILILAIPVLVIAWADSNVFFFIRACVVFLVSFGVTSFIFLPKAVQLHFAQERDFSRASSVHAPGSMAFLEQIRRNARKCQQGERLSNLSGSSAMLSNLGGDSSGIENPRTIESSRSYCGDKKQNDIDDPAKKEDMPSVPLHGELKEEYHSVSENPASSCGHTGSDDASSSKHATM